MRNPCKHLARALCLTGLLTIAGPAAANPPDIWGAKFIVSQLTLNASGFISFLKVVNPQTSSGVACTADTASSVCRSDQICSTTTQKCVVGTRGIKADITFELAEGIKGAVTQVELGAVGSGGIATISEAAILTAIGEPTQLVDVSMVIYIQNADAIVLAEKRASDGRLGIPVERVFLLTDPFASS